MATYNFLDKTGLGLVWAKIKALVVQSDWEESDTTDSAFIQNKPSVRAGTGTDSVVINGDDDSNCAIYTLYITQTQADVLAGKKYYTYTTEDTLPSASNLINRGIFYFDNTDASGEVTWSKIKSIDTTNHTIEVYNRATGGFPTNKEAKIYYKYKLAIGEESLAEGSLTSAIGYQSHAEGNGSNASGSSSHAEGTMTSAIGSSSHTEGNRTIAASSYQHVQGKYNIEDADGTYAHIVGNGSSSARSNAHTLDWSGNAWYAGKVTVGAAPTNNMDVATKQYVDEEFLLVTFTQGSGEYLVADKTITEILAAATAGKRVVGRYTYNGMNGEIPLATYNASMPYVYFATTMTTGGGSNGEIIVGEVSYLREFSTLNTDERWGFYNRTSSYTSNTLTGLSDTTVSSPSNGQILKYDGTTSKWINANEVTVPSASSITPSADGTGSAGTSTAYARADHVHPQSGVTSFNGSTGAITYTAPVTGVTLNGSSSSAPSFYAPTGVGTSGYVLKSNGSGAPTWAAETDTNTTYILSMSSNVITLTGSDGTTSSVTLPVYNGGVVTPT